MILKKNLKKSSKQIYISEVPLLAVNIPKVTVKKYLAQTYLLKISEIIVNTILAEGSQFTMVNYSNNYTIPVKNSD